MSSMHYEHRFSVIYFLLPVMDEKSTLSGKIILNTDIIATAATEAIRRIIRTKIPIKYKSNTCMETYYLLDINSCIHSFLFCNNCLITKNAEIAIKKF